jgi:hypothetical protein
MVEIFDATQKQYEGLSLKEETKPNRKVLDNTREKWPKRFERVTYGIHPRALQQQFLSKYSDLANR